VSHLGGIDPKAKQERKMIMHNTGGEPNLYPNLENQYLSEQIIHENTQRGSLQSYLDIVRNTRQEFNTSHV